MSRRRSHRALFRHDSIDQQLQIVVEKSQFFLISFVGIEDLFEEQLMFAFDEGAFDFELNGERERETNVALDDGNNYSELLKRKLTNGNEEEGEKKQLEDILLS